MSQVPDKIQEDLIELQYDNKCLDIQGVQLKLVHIEILKTVRDRKTVKC